MESLVTIYEKVVVRVCIPMLQKSRYLWNGSLGHIRQIALVMGLAYECANEFVNLFVASNDVHFAVVGQRNPDARLRLPHLLHERRAKAAG